MLVTCFCARSLVQAFGKIRVGGARFHFEMHPNTYIILRRVNIHANDSLLDLTNSSDQSSRRKLTTERIH